MGCDIHAFAEIKINGFWHTYDCLRIDRNYWLFARMANVRNYDEIKPISRPRGLPADISLVAKLESDHLGSDGHSHSWLSLQEMEELEREFENRDRFAPFDYLFSNGWTSRSLIPGVQDARLVFWFDN